MISARAIGTPPLLYVKMGDFDLNAARSRLEDAERHFAYQNDIIARLEAAGRRIGNAEILLLKLRVTVLREQEALGAFLQGTALAVDAY